MNKSFLTDSRLKIALHGFLWVIIFIFPIYIYRTFGFADIKPVLHFYTTAVSYGIIFYVSYLYLLPNFYFKNRKWVFLLLMVALIAVLYLGVNVINDHLIGVPDRSHRFEAMNREMAKNETPIRPPFELFRFVNYCFSSIMIVGFSLGLGYVDRHREDEKKRKELEKEKLHSELAFLKNQISPHFFFNTLNNIYTLTGIDTPAAQESILKLSKLMRYLLYESEHGETSLRNEIDFMTNYISLMKLRLSPKVDLQVSFPSDYADVAVPPLLFISFIENAFKHGVSHREASFIHIDMTIQENSIRFVTENSMGKSNQPSDDGHSGIGLENIQKRLALLFPGKHRLNISQTEQVFKVELEIECKTQSL